MAIISRNEVTFTFLLLVTIHSINAQYYPQPSGDYEGGGNGYGYEEPPQPIKLRLNLNLPSITIKTRPMELPQMTARVDLGSNPKGQYGGQNDYGSASNQHHNYYYPQPQPMYDGPGHYPSTPSSYAASSPSQVPYPVPAQWTPHRPVPLQHYGPPAPPQYGPSPYPHPAYHQHAPPPNRPYPPKQYDQ